ncbi:MAG: DNA-3-methyladenine glycosylase [Mycetocola sp.]
MLLLSDLVTSPAVECAPLLLGSHIVATGPDGDVTVRVTEVEAYHGRGTAGPVDECSHARMGRTDRNASMWGPPGHWYVYLNYGMHHALNLVCSPSGTASGVLIRAGEVVAGHDLVRSRRGDKPGAHLARGPGNLAQALGLTSRRLDGSPALGGGELTISLADVAVSENTNRIRSGPRVGVNPAATGGTLPWRFWLDGDPTVSAFRVGGQPRNAGAAKKSRSSSADR